jgi:HEPN domain-containing protein
MKAPSEDAKFDAARVVSYWTSESADDPSVADHMVEKGDYSYALFFGHLATEKLLKAVFTRKLSAHAPPVHNLVRLARLAHLDLSPEREESLTVITAFNLEARYPDLQRSFRRQCTPEYTMGQLRAIEELVEWLKSQLA